MRRPRYRRPSWLLAQRCALAACWSIAHKDWPWEAPPWRRDYPAGVYASPTVEQERARCLEVLLCSLGPRVGP